MPRYSTATQATTPAQATTRQAIPATTVAVLSDQAELESLHLIGGHQGIFFDVRCWCCMIQRQEPEPGRRLQ